MLASHKKIFAQLDELRYDLEGLKGSLHNVQSEIGISELLSSAPGYGMHFGPPPVNSVKGRLSAQDLRIKTLENKTTTFGLVGRANVVGLHIDDAAEEGTRRIRIPGTIVGYYPKNHMTLWTGVVIPRPLSAYPRYSKAGIEFVYVVRDGDFLVRGCLPENLYVRIPGGSPRFGPKA